MTQKVIYFFKESKYSSPLWLLVRLFVGYKWLSAGLDKIVSPDWVGRNSGISLVKFLNSSLTKASGPHPDVMSWYAFLIQHVFIPIAPYMSYIVAFGEVIVGIGLIIGFKTRLSALFGSFMNFNYLFSGAVSINPLLLLLQILIIICYKSARFLGIDELIKYFKNKKR
jgi:thiosulfate dehydrogenase [quinone] large subunit